LSAAERPRRSRLFEQLFGRGALRLDALHVRLDARNLGLKRFDAFLELVDRQRIKVLLAKRDQRIVRLAGEEIVQIHGRNR
jgi:hypothetical protein